MRLTSDSSRLPSLTGLRFVAAFMVLLCHIGISLIPRVAPNDWIAVQFCYTAGEVGVSFFFVLSGFVLTWVARPDDTKVLFWRRRIVKIFPNHLVTLAAAVVLMLGAGFAVTAANTIPQLFLVQSWIPRQALLLDFTSNTPTWSLACELLFYLSFPWLFAAVKRIRPERLWAWVAVVALAIFAVAAVAQLMPDNERIFGIGEPWLTVWFRYFFPPARALEFMLGILMAQIVIHGRWIRLQLVPAVLLAAFSYVMSAFAPDAVGEVATTAVPLALMIAAAATADIQQRSTAFGGRTMVWLGEVSFALYMVHWLVVAYGPIRAADQSGWGVASSVPKALVDAGLTIAISLIIAALLYTLVERPAMRRWSRPAVRVPTDSVAREPEPVGARRWPTLARPGGTRRSGR